MAGMVPQSVQKLEKSIEGMMEQIQKEHLLPKQKDAFLCCARCCDASDNMQQLQNCVERCSAGSAQAQKMIHGYVHEFQERLQRCAHRCQDLARDGIGYEPTAREQERAQEKFGSCMEGCGNECLERIPKLKADIVSQLKKL